MAREATVRWDAHAHAWRSDVGPRGRNGRRTPVYFRRDEGGAEIPESKRGGRAAGMLLDRYLQRRDEGEAAGARGLDDPTVEQLRLLWLSHVKRTATPESYQVARSAIGQFCGFARRGAAMGDRRASTLTTTDLAEFLEAKRAAGRRPHYLAKLAGTVQAMLNWAADPRPGRHPEKLLAGGNPLRGMAAPRVPDSPERFAETAAVAAFLRAWLRAARGGRNPGGKTERYARLAALLLRCLVQTGARPGELCKAQWGDVDWEAGRNLAGHAFGKITLPPERWKAGKATGKHRVIYLTPTLTRALRREFARPDRHPTYLFCHIRKRRAEKGDGTGLDPWTSAALAARVRKVRRRAIAAGVELLDAGPNRIVNYLWRHTAASRALMRGMDPVTVAALLGTSPDMLRKHYGHILDSHLVEAAATLADARRPRK